MKKILSLAAISLALGCLNMNGQSYFRFASSSKAVWENLSTPGSATIIPAPASFMNVAFLVGSGTPLIGNSGSPTNAEALVSWSTIFGDPNFHFAINADTGQLAVTPTVGSGAFNYNSNLTFPVTGTTPGATYDVFAIAWTGDANPQQAAAAGNSFGWSNTFSYQTGTLANSLLNFSQSGMGSFGLVVPEPSAVSLASLGGIALAFFRRRK